MNYFDSVSVENIEMKINDDTPPFLVGASLNASGENFYDFQKTITEKYTCVIHAESGTLRYFNEDASTIAPGVGERVFGIDEITPDGVTFDGSWKFDEETLSFYQDADIVASKVLRANTAKRDLLLKIATAAITSIQNSAAIGNPRDGDEENLLILQQYADAFRDIDLTTPEPNWPVPPDSIS